MKNFFILLLTVYFFSSNSKKGNIIEPKDQYDSISYYFSKSQDSKLSLKNRLSSINKAIKISSKSNWQPIDCQIGYQKNHLLFSLGEYDSLQIFHKILITSSLKNNNSYYAAKSYYLIGYYYGVVQKKPDSAFVNYNLSKKYYQKIGDTTWVGKNLLNMGTIQKDQNDFFGSKETLTTALPYLIASNDSSDIAGAFNIIGTNHRRLLNFEEATYYYEKAITTTQSKKNKLAYKNNLATAHIDNRDFNRAIKILQELKKDSILKEDSSQYARILDNLAYAQLLSGKKPKKQAFLTPLRIRKKNNDKRGQIASYTHLGQFYSKTSPRKATFYFDSVIHLSKKIKIPRAEKDVLKFLMELKPKNIDIRNRYVVLQDSIYEQELKVSTRFAKYKYDDKVKQEENVRLEKENAEKELEVVRQRNQKLALTGLGGVLFLTFGFFSYYFLQRNKRLKKEKAMAALHAIHETEADLSRRLHDDFGGKLNNTMVMLQNKADTTEVLNVVDELYNQSRDFSREINVVDTGENFKEELLQMLRFRTPSDAKLIHSGITNIKWPSIAPISKTTLFKVLQELMINMGKYSNATLISINFSATSKTLKVNYADDGDGATNKELQTKNGLRNTEKRIQALRGSITFDSEKGNGFRAEIKIPK